MNFSAALAGFATGAGLIIAIGAQNAFVLRQGLRREYVGLVVLTCIFGDVLCITLGVAGMAPPSRRTRWCSRFSAGAAPRFSPTTGVSRSTAPARGAKRSGSRGRR